jgi:hypothetical protein
VRHNAQQRRENKDDGAMNTVRVIFARNNLPISLLIRVVTWSRWSHCAIVDGDTVIEAKGGCGVVRTSLKDFTERYTDYAFADMPVIDTRKAAIQRAAAEIGKPYDLKALFGILFRTGWECGDSWFCSEHVAHASGIFRSERVSRITPEMIWSVTK